MSDSGRAFKIQEKVESQWRTVDVLYLENGELLDQKKRDILSESALPCRLIEITLTSMSDPIVLR